MDPHWYSSQRPDFLFFSMATADAKKGGRGEGGGGGPFTAPWPLWFLLTLVVFMWLLYFHSSSTVSKLSVHLPLPCPNHQSKSPLDLIFESLAFRPKCGRSSFLISSEWPLFRPKLSCFLDEWFSWVCGPASCRWQFVDQTLRLTLTRFSWSLYRLFMPERACWLCSFGLGRHMMN